ncbi:hypothetical protein QFC19_001719 [Naganishia cerealis]|uniref:Uncharacterized protein n=1 Tax=Naganishia cerealis TaxID=610337 RepID=A0ACC2WFX3_9TREE|nr:hypothetical protein QFC19_001719 [Naganishia cerealis]
MPLPRGAPTSTENWDDDFDFQLPSQPGTSSSRTTATTQPGLDVFGYTDEANFPVEPQKLARRERVIESWEDDFDYDPLDWTKDVEAKVGTEGKTPSLPWRNVERIPREDTQDVNTVQPSLLPRSQPPRSTSTLVLTTPTSEDNAKPASAERPRPLSAIVSAAQSDRRDRKRSDRFPSQSSGSRGYTNIQLRTPGTSLPGGTVLVHSEKSSKVANLKEGVFMRRISSVRRRISSSISMGPSSVNNILLADTPPSGDQTTTRSTLEASSRDKREGHSKAVASVDMMSPPTLPISVLRTSSVMNVAARSERALTSSPSDPPRRISLEGLPYHPVPNAIYNQQPQRLLEGIPAGIQESKRAKVDDRRATIDGTTTSFEPVITRPSLENSRRTSAYGFHLPSPVAGSAYNIANLAQGGRRTSHSRVSESYAAPDMKHLESEMQGMADKTSSKHGQSDDGQASKARDSLSSAHAGPEDLHKALRSATMSNSQRARLHEEETALQNYRFGASTRNAAVSESADTSARKQAAPQTTSHSSTAATLATSRKEKARLTLNRIGSLSQRHGRKISDGWRTISGSAPSERSVKVHARAGVPGLGTRDSTASSDQDMTIKMSPREMATKDTTFVIRESTQSSEALSLPTDQRNVARFASPVSQQSQVIPAAMRSLSQNDSPTATRFKSIVGDQMSTENIASERGIGRRSSMGDLKIPSRVVSAQKGLKEEIGAMKQFAAGIQDLKALMAQHTILRVKQDRSGANDVLLDITYAPWWSLADLLVQLGETGSISTAVVRPAFDSDDTESRADIRRQRRITLAPGSVLPSPHQSALTIDTESSSSLIQGAIHATEPSCSSEPASESPAGRATQRSISNAWRASTGQIDFSFTQLEELRAILEKPRPLSITGASPTVRQKQTATLLPATKLEDARRTLGPASSQAKTMPSQRRSSKSNVTVFKDFWRAASGSQRSGGTVNLSSQIPEDSRSALPRSHIRPSLASLFRRSSSKVPKLPIPTPLRFSSDRIEFEVQDESASSTSVLSVKCASPESSSSDWDTPKASSTPLDQCLGTEQQSRIGSLRPDAELTITRSDSRKLLAGLGRGQSPASETKSLSLQPTLPAVPLDSLISALPPDVSNTSVSVSGKFAHAFGQTERCYAALSSTSKIG